MKKTFLLLLPLILLSSNTQAAQKKAETWQVQRKAAVERRAGERRLSCMQAGIHELDALIEVYEPKQKQGNVHTIQDFAKKWKEEELRSLLTRKDLLPKSRKTIEQVLQWRAERRESDKHLVAELKQTKQELEEAIRDRKKTEALKAAVAELERQQKADRAQIETYGAAVDKEERRTEALKAAVAELERQQKADRAQIEANGAVLAEWDAQNKAFQAQLDQWDAQAKAKAAAQWSITKLGVSTVCAIVGICTCMALKLALKLQKSPKAKAITLPQQEIEKRKDRDGRDEESD